MRGAWQQYCNSCDGKASRDIHSAVSLSPGPCGPRGVSNVGLHVTSNRVVFDIQGLGTAGLVGNLHLCCAWTFAMYPAWTESVTTVHQLLCTRPCEEFGRSHRRVWQRAAGLFQWPSMLWGNACVLVVLRPRVRDGLTSLTSTVCICPGAGCVHLHYLHVCTCAVVEL
jgi:hypothetical protein